MREQRGAQKPNLAPFEIMYSGKSGRSYDSCVSVDPFDNFFLVKLPHNQAFLTLTIPKMSLSF